MKKVIIIGGGIGGLATAALLGKKGYSVTIVERNTTVGGRATVYKENGFTFDMGPSWYQMPEALDHYFTLFHKKTADFYTLIKLDPQYRVFFENGETFDTYKNTKKTLQAYLTLDPQAKENIELFLKKAETYFSLSRNHVMYNNPHALQTYLNTKTSARQLLASLPVSIEKAVHQITKHHHLRQLLLYTVLFQGGSPKVTPSLFSLMAHLDIVVGNYYPMGGMQKVVAALVTLCKAHGVTIHTGQTVTNICVENKRVTKVLTEKKAYTADILISNADYAYTETQLLQKNYQTYPPSYWKKKTFAPSAFVVYLGVKGRIPELAHHNLFFSDNWDTHFHELFKKPSWPTNPSYYVSCPSITDPSVAPKNHENLFITVQIPTTIEDTTKIRKEYLTKILHDIEVKIGHSFKKNIVVQKIFSKKDYEQTYLAYNGTAIGLANTFSQSAFFRPRYKSKKVQNLYYVGQYTHPGPGVPTCIIAAENVANIIHTDYGNA